MNLREKFRNRSSLSLNDLEEYKPQIETALGQRFEFNNQHKMDYFTLAYYYNPEEIAEFKSNELQDFREIGKEIFDERIKQEKLLNDMDVEEGNVVCINKQCRSKKIVKKQVQMRSGDEGANFIFKCQTCGTSWVV